VKSRSIGFRLTAWYFLVFACGIAVFSVAAWFVVRASLYRAVDDELRTRIQGVQSFLQREAESLSAPEIREEFREQSDLGPGGELFQVCDEHGVWLYRSAFLESANVPIPSPGALEQSRFEDLKIGRRRLRIYAQRVSVNNRPYTIQVAAPVNEIHEALERFRLALLLAAPLFLIAASIGGYWLSTRALAPVDEISQAAQRISIENLAARLQVVPTGDQLQRLSETLNAMLARLEASVHRINQFTGDASHELRAPVALIRTTAEVALQKDRNAAEYREALEEILQESERTSQVVESLMLLARADASKDSLECVPVDACEVIHEAVEQGEKLARAHGLQFNASTPSDPITIKADAEALRRAFLIFLDNAVKYTPSGGTVGMQVKTNNGYVVVSVSDTGIGIAAEDLPHIFDRFWRADKARSREHGGAGLGLAIAKWIADMHNGSITVESEPSKGSVFHFHIPLHREGLA